MNTDTIIVHYWRSRNPYNGEYVIMNDQSLDLAHRLADILLSGNNVLRTQVVHARFVDGWPHEDRYDRTAQGGSTHRVATYARDRKGGIVRTGLETA